MKRRPVLEGTPLTPGQIVFAPWPRGKEAERRGGGPTVDTFNDDTTKSCYTISSGGTAERLRGHHCGPSPPPTPRFVCLRTTGVVKRRGLVLLDLRRAWRRGCRFSFRGVHALLCQRAGPTLRSLLSGEHGQRVNLSLTKHLPSLGPFPGGLTIKTETHAIVVGSNDPIFPVHSRMGKPDAKF